jgi:hypothetical protein
MKELEARRKRELEAKGAHKISFNFTEDDLKVKKKSLF